MHDWMPTAAAAICLAVTLGASAQAAERSGTAVAVVQSTEASGSTGRRVLVTTGPVYMGDTIRTGAQGEAQIQLADDTRLVVGPNSSMVVDAFVFSNNGTAKDVALNAVRGAFRFVTGNSPKGAYKITTPTATIGVRGTQFDFSVDRSGQLNFALFEGQARICSNTGQCMVLSGACSVAVIPRNGAISRLPAGNQRTSLLATAFPYIASQRSLRPTFRVDTSSCGIRKADIQRENQLSPIFADQLVPGPIVTPPGPVVTPPGVDPGTTGTIGNRNGFADGTNPGLGSYHNNASGGGSLNPGGTGGGGGNGGGGGSNGNGNGNGHGNGPKG